MILIILQYRPGFLKTYLLNIFTKTFNTFQLRIFLKVASTLGKNFFLQAKISDSGRKG